MINFLENNNYDVNNTIKNEFFANDKEFFNYNFFNSYIDKNNSNYHQKELKELRITSFNLSFRK